MVLVGDQPQLEAIVAAAGPVPPGRVEFVHAPVAVDMKEKPGEALRRKPDASIFRCWQLLAEERSTASSAPATPARWWRADCKTRKFLKCVHRPGIATVMPTAKGRASSSTSARTSSPSRGTCSNTASWAASSPEHARRRAADHRPDERRRGGGQGARPRQKTYDLFRTGPLKERFVGNIEGRDIHRGAADVVVTDGFIGNVVLKLSEGVFEFVMKMVNQEVIGALSAEKDKAIAP